MKGPFSVDQATIKKLVDIVLTNLRDESFSVEKLAEEAGMSRVTCHRKVKSIEGKSVSRFIREIRLQKAFELLQNNEGNISEIAFKVGFGSPTYFIKCFHDYYGFPPGEVRELDSNELQDDQILGKNRGPADYKNPKIDPGIKSVLKRNRLKNIFIASLTVLLVLLIGYSLYTPRKPLENSIAVLPFRNVSLDSNSLPLINGTMEAIIDNLCAIEDLSVIPRPSVESFRNSILPTREIARQLKVNYILEGSAQISGGKFRLTLRLIDAVKDKYIWSHPYEGTTEDVFTLPGQIAKAVAAKLKATITPEEKQLLEVTPKINLTAYDFYWRGRDEYVKFLTSPVGPEALSKAEYYYHKALEYDPALAQVYAGLARICWRKDYIPTYYSENFLDSVRILCNIALSINDKVEEAYITRGNYYKKKGLEDSAALDYKTALEINPNSWEAYFNMPTKDFVKRIENFFKAASINRGPELQVILKDLAYDLGRKFGFPEQAKVYYQEALALDGDSSSYYSNLAGLERSQGNFFKEIEYLLKSYKLDSSLIDRIRYLGTAYGRIGQYKESLKYMKMYLDKQQNPEIPEIVHDAHRIGYAYWMNGDTINGKYYFNRQLAGLFKEIELHRGIEEELLYYDIAVIYAFLGEKDKAFDNLGKYNQNKITYQGMLTWLKTDPLFDSIKDEPEFRRIVRDQEVKYQTEHEKMRKWLEENDLL